MKGGMVFGGCSFTWGQGLYYYSKMSTIKRPPPEQFSYELLTDAHYEYMRSNRYSRLVANHFETFDIVRNHNGGSEEQNLDFFDSIFSKNGAVYRKHDVPCVDPHYHGIFDYSEIDHIVLQTSVVSRNSIKLTYEGKDYRLGWQNQKKEDQRLLYKWMEENNIHGFPGYYEFLLNGIFTKIKDAFEFYESKGIKCWILCWQDDYINSILNDEFMNQRFITFDYLDKNYKCLDHMIQSNDNLFIKEDHAFFGDDCPQDSHPSKLCHKVIAENIIKKLENE